MSERKDVPPIISGRVTFEKPGELQRCDCREQGMCYVDGPFVIVHRRFHGITHTIVVDTREIVREYERTGKPVAASRRLPRERPDSCIHSVGE